MSLISDELDYKKYTSSHPTYTYSKVLPQNGVQAVALTTAGGEETIFELPPKVYNFSKSNLVFSLTPSAGTHFNKMFSDCVPAIRQIQVYTRTGLFLVDLNYANNYTNAISRHETPLDEILQNDKPANAYGYWEGLYPSNQLSKQTAAETIIRPAAAAATATVGTVNGAVDSAGVSGIFEPGYCIVGADTTATPVINYKIPLKFFKNTGLEVDKDVYFGGETLYVKIIWEKYTRLGYNTTNEDNDNTGHAALTSGAIAGVTLFMAIEQNSVVENEVKNRVMSAEGLRIQWPMVYTNLIPLAAGAGALHAVQVRYNRGHGSKLKKVYWVPFHQTNTTWQSFDHNNTLTVVTTGAGPATYVANKVSSFYTTVNNIRTSQFDYSIANGEDWMVKKESLKGSCISSSDEYYYNFTWIEDFTGNMSLLDKAKLPDQHNIDDGLDLTSEVIYTINATNNNKALNHHIFAVTQKELIVNSTGIQLL